MVGSLEYAQQTRKWQLGFLISQGLQSWHYLLDVGCGTLRGGLPILAYMDRGHYMGIDVRPDVIDAAWDECREAHLLHKQPRLRAVPPSPQHWAKITPPSFDYIWCFSTLIHCTDSVLFQLLPVIKSMLHRENTQAACYANVNIGHWREEDWRGEFPLVWRPFPWYAEIGYRYGLRVESLGTLAALRLRTEPGRDAQHMVRMTPWGAQACISASSSLA